MKVYVVFKYILAWHKDSQIDSIWRGMNDAYERMESLQSGGYIETHEVSRRKSLFAEKKDDSH